MFAPPNQYFWFPLARVFAQHFRKLQVTTTGEDADFVRTQKDLAGLLAYAQKLCGGNPITRELTLNHFRFTTCISMREHRLLTSFAFFVCLTPCHDAIYTDLQLDKLQAYIAGEDDVLATNISPSASTSVYTMTPP